MKVNDKDIKKLLKDTFDSIYIKGNNGCPCDMILPSADFEDAFKEYVMNLQKEL